MDPPEPHVLNPTPTISKRIYSSHVGQDYLLYVSLPRCYEETDVRYPVLYILDGHAMFTLTREIMELQQFVGLLPELILVGVSYPVQTHMETLALRGRDFTFERYSEELMAALRASLGYPYGDTGGGEAFLQFLRFELLPLIEQQYRADPLDRGLLGDSMGADFLMRAIMREPTLFARAIAIAPYIGDGNMDIPTAEARFAKSHADLPIKHFLGSEEYFLTPDQDKAKVLRKFLDTMSARNYTGLTLSSRMYEGEDHFSVIPIAVTHALRLLYGQPPNRLCIVSMNPESWRGAPLMGAPRCWKDWITRKYSFPRNTAQFLDSLPLPQREFLAPFMTNPH